MSALSDEVITYGWNGYREGESSIPKPGRAGGGAGFIAGSRLNGIDLKGRYR